MKIKPILSLFTGLIPFIQSRSLTNNNQRTLVKMPEKFGNGIERLPDTVSDSLISRRNPNPVDEKLPIEN